MECYDVMLNSSPVGTVRITPEGLFLRFQCWCHLPDKQIYRLQVCNNNRTIDLGICVPEGDSYYVDKRVRKQDVADRKMTFSLQAQTNKSDQNDHLIDPQKPFHYIRNLPDSRLAIRDGIYKIVISG